MQESTVQNHAIWTMKKNLCGTLNMESVCLTGVAPPCTKQYPISKEAMDATKVLIKDLWDMGIVEKTPRNRATLMYPTDTTLLEHDCCELVKDQLSDGLLKVIRWKTLSLSYT